MSEFCGRYCTLGSASGAILAREMPPGGRLVFQQNRLVKVAK
jgi:hypothetical protein